MPKLFRWCRWNSATFIATLAAAIALVTGASVALANSTVGTAQAANSGSAHAVSAGITTSGIAPAMSCSGIAQLDLAGAVPGVPFEIGSATEIAASANTLGSWAACDVKGVIAPQLHFEIKLPETGWQADYLQVGCGGLCGNTSVNNAPASAGCMR
ncbi:tannase/feruloyl esterase family alpha/beta hydrolase [Streptomyces sp. NBC_01239]|uniref:hypothetical protein n=1 Tax=Streptomyces sp. NBC_01239 TaxID=2903792 RepID=UPI0022584F42|nr:hypothetical protein [Streptomyces sp. NBC_01239]MCX4809152.1 tannase/feruloyl esterase family alpha/beta hydrolase [Streptomyces sp. NBC_01239]